jgi:hypothetical protein
LPFKEISARASKASTFVKVLSKSITKYLFIFITDSKIQMYEKSKPVNYNRYGCQE